MGIVVIIMQNANIKDNSISLMIVTDPKSHLEPIVIAYLLSIKRLTNQAHHQVQVKILNINRKRTD